MMFWSPCSGLVDLLHDPDPLEINLSRRAPELFLQPIDPGLVGLYARGGNRRLGRHVLSPVYSSSDCSVYVARCGFGTASRRGTGPTSPRARLTHRCGGATVRSPRSLRSPTRVRSGCRAVLPRVQWPRERVRYRSDRRWISRASSEAHRSTNTIAGFGLSLLVDVAVATPRLVLDASPDRVEDLEDVSTVVRAEV